MSKAKFKEKQKKLHEQRVRPTEGTEVVPAWDYDFSGANEVHQSDDFEPLESVALFIPEGKSKTREKFKKKRDKARHKLDVSVSPETASDYLASLNARDAVPPTVLVRDDIPDNVQESTLSKPASRPIFEPAIKKTSKTLSIVERAGELKKDVHIISYGNTLYYYNKYYYTQLDAKQLIKLYRKHVDYELNNESSLHGYKDLYDCFMTDPKIECNEPEDELIYAPLKNGVFELVEWKLHPHSPDQVTFTYIKAKYAPKAECPIFEGYLHRVTGGDPQLMERFWMVIGYLLIYPARGKFFIFMKGVGNSGKSVLGSFIRNLYPKESISSIRLKNLTNQFGMASLATSVINFDMDMPSSRINDEAASRLKQITGGDSMNIPRKYRDDALLERRIKFVFSSNHPLIIDGEDEALIKRIVYLPFNYAIPDDQQDPYLGEKIWAERDAIVTKALYYARKLVQRNYIFPEIPYVDSAKYSPVKRFVQEICDTSNINAEVALSDLYEAYRIVQNEEAFRFTDDLLGEGVTYETAGSLQGGKKVWMLAKLPEKYIIAGDEVTPYLVFFNSHDGSSGVKVAMTPVRVVCQNTLNLALSSAKRIWTARHTENVLLRVQDARETLQLANGYMAELGKGIHELTTIKLSDRKVQEFINEFFPITEDLTDGQRKNNLRLQEDLKARYYNAPDLEWVGKNGWRFVNAVSDFATHADPIRKTRNYNENLFLRTAEGNPMIDKAYKMVLAAA